MALLKWMHHNGVGDDSLSLSLRTDSQDAWVFQPPLAHEMALKADFFMGLILYIFARISTCLKIFKIELF